MLEKLPIEEKTAALNAAKEAAQSLWDFLTAMHEEREACA